MNVGVKYDREKIQPSLMSATALEELCKILTYGAKKYSPDNWRLIDDKRYEDALIRHYIAYKKGELRDQESGFFHLGHMFANVMFLLDKELERNATIKD
jgi:hypothetical protein